MADDDTEQARSPFKYVAAAIVLRRRRAYSPLGILASPGNLRRMCCSLIAGSSRMSMRRRLRGRMVVREDSAVVAMAPVGARQSSGSSWSTPDTLWCVRACR